MFEIFNVILQHRINLITLISHLCRIQYVKTSKIPYKNYIINLQDKEMKCQTKPAHQ
jgi:hypothetical protein